MIFFDRWYTTEVDAKLMLEWYRQEFDPGAILVRKQSLERFGILYESDKPLSNGHTTLAKRNDKNNYAGGILRDVRDREVLGTKRRGSIGRMS